jgi:IS5 family transposase
LWESILPAEAVRLPKDLVGADRVLSDPALVEVFRAFFDPDRGRRSIPMETYVRLMFVKWYLKMGYGRMTEFVAGSITLRVFARIGIDQAVPDPSTLKRITKRCGPEAIAALNRVLLVGAVGRGLVDVSRVRTDTTIVDANIAYPTDSGLLTKAVKGLVGNGRVLSAGLGLDTTVADVTGELAGMNQRLGRWLKSRDPHRRDEILIVTDEIAGLASGLGVDAARVLADAELALGKITEANQRAPKGTRRAFNTLRVVLDALDPLVHQAVQRARERPVAAAEKRLSISDGDARPMSKGTTKKGTQFGYTAEISEDANGLIVDYNSHIGQPGDSDLIGPAVTAIAEVVGAVPTAVTADKTYGAAHARTALTETGVKLVAVVARGSPGPERQKVEDTDEFKALTRWRAGIEARVSTLKRDHGWDRVRIRVMCKVGVGRRVGRV